MQTKDKKLENHIESQENEEKNKIYNFYKKIKWRSSIRERLLRQFIETLRVNFLSIKSMSTSESAKKDIIEYLEDQFNDPSITWQKAYDIEQKLVFIMSPEQLDVEWDRRIVEAEGIAFCIRTKTEICKYQR
jgi:hypothetical protein